MHKEIRSYRETLRGNRVSNTYTIDYDLISLDDEGLKIHAKWVRENSMEFEPPILLIPANLEEGTWFETEPAQRNPATGNTTIWKSRIEGFEEITVPAGTFEAMKVRLLVRDSQLGTKFADVEMWFAEGAGVEERYNHLYSPDELAPWVERVTTMAAESRESIVITNNHFRGQAIANGLELQSALLPSRDVPVPVCLVEQFPRLRSIPGLRVESDDEFTIPAFTAGETGQLEMF